MKKFGAVILTVVLAAGLFGFGGTAVSAAGKFLAPIEAPNPRAFTISTAQELYNVRNRLAGSFVLTNDIDLSGFNGGEWTPIGTDFSGAFTGVFDGQGHVIRNLTITGADYELNGLFGYAEDAVIKNVGLENTNIEAEVSGSNVGGVAGFNTGEISNCYNTGVVSVFPSPDNIYASGIAGGIAGDNSGGKISACYNAGAVLVSATSASVSAFAFTGGITGFNTGEISVCHNTGDVSASSFESEVGGIAGRNMNEISNCYNTSAVSAFDDIQAKAGGIAGRNHGAISACHNTGDVSASSFESRVGGIAGTNWGEISGCYNTGDVSACSSFDSYAGGIVGMNFGEEIRDCYNTGAVSDSVSYSDSSHAGGIVGYNSDSTISACYNTGDVFASSSTSSLQAPSYAGGIVGKNYGTISACHNMGAVTASSASSKSYAGGIAGITSDVWDNEISACYNTGDVSASSSSDISAYAGGIAGYSNGKISDCYNIGDVYSSSSYAGGIVGYNSDSTINACYNTGGVSASSSSYLFAYAGGIAGCNTYGGTISGCYNTGDVTASSDSSDNFSFAGGIVGDSLGEISDCYNAGIVTAFSSDFNFAGGIAGYNSGEISACYNTGAVAVSSYSSYAGGIVGRNYNSTITNAYCLDLYNSSYGTQRSAAQMRQKSSLAGFDFETVWDINASLNSGYPYLRSFKPAWQAGAALPVKNLFPDGEIADIQILAAGGETVDICANFNFMLNHITFAAAVYDDDGRLSAFYRAHTDAPYAADLTLSGVPKEDLQKNMQIFIWDALTLAPYIEAVCNF